MGRVYCYFYSRVVEKIVQIIYLVRTTHFMAIPEEVV